MASGSYKSTGRLVRFILRRDRIRIPVWILSIVLVTFATALAFGDLYKTEGDRQAIAITMMNPAMEAMLGPAYGLDNLTIGSMMAHEMLLFTTIAVAIMSILLVNRHTRTDEEEGRTEMIRALPTGRLSNITSTIVVLIGTNLLLALLMGFGLYSLNIESMDLEGTLLYGLTLGTTGILFAALTAVFAQISNSSRGAIGLSFAVLILAYLIRAIGDISNETLSLISPLGWILRTEVYVTNQWWPVLLSLVVSALFILLAFYLNSIRDVGVGMLPSKSGKRHASNLLLSPLGLSLRIQRTAIISWAIGMFVLGTSYGSILGEMDMFVKEVDIIQQMMPMVHGFSLTEQFIAMIMSIMSLLATVPPIVFLYKLKGEEKRNRTEHLLGRAVSRMKLLGSYLVISVLSGFVMLSLIAIGLWIAGDAVVEGGLSFWSTYNAAVIYMPAMAVMIGLGVFFIGLLPKLTGLTWLYLTFTFFVVYLGELLQFPNWVSNLSPFQHVPQIPIEEMNYVSVAIMAIIFILLCIFGFVGYRRRDIEG